MKRTLSRAEARFRPRGLGRGSLRYDRFAEPKQAQPAKAGGARRDRTADLVIANDALSQLSYGPVATASKTRTSGRQSPPFTVRPDAKSRTPKSMFPGSFLPGTSLVCEVGKRYLARIIPREPLPPCAPFSTSS